MDLEDNRKEDDETLTYIYIANNLEGLDLCYYNTALLHLQVFTALPVNTACQAKWLCHMTPPVSMETPTCWTCLLIIPSKGCS